MATAAEVVTHAWTQWGIQALVLLSFTLQVTLLVLAEFRRRVDSGLLRFFTWSAYMLADTTAIYVLGHMSVARRRSLEQELVQFWAPFLLLHLGGQDNVTAYAVEDNRLWLRQLQTLAVQVAATAYVLYGSSTTPLLRPAAALVFVVGLVRYGERVWALKRASSSPTGSSSNYRSGERQQWLSKYLVRAKFTGITGGAMNSEAILLIAHELLSIPKDLLVEGAFPIEGLRTDLTGEDAYRVVEMQLSLMHDVFYTKAEVLHTWYGLCVRVASLLAIAVAFLLFQLLLLRRNQGLRYSSLDVGVTYALLVGALVLEVASVVRLLFSSWTYTLLSNRAYEGRWRIGRRACHLLARAVVSLRLLVHATDRRRGGWSRSMGQLGLLSLCARSVASRRSTKIARWMGMDDAWSVWACSSSVPVPALVEEQMVKQLLLARDSRSSADHHVVNPWDRQAMERWGLQEDLGWSVDESVLVWHVATDIYLCWYKNQHNEGDGEQEQARRRGRADAVQALSGYMLYLLAARPDVMPRPGDRSAYVQMCYALVESKKTFAKWTGLPALDHRSANDLAASLWLLGNALNNPGSVGVGYATAIPVIGRRDWEMVVTAAKLGDKLISEDQSLACSPSTGDGVLQLIFRGWVDMLFYLGCQCTAYSHVKQLSNGGELVTVAAILAKYITGFIATADPPLDPPSFSSPSSSSPSFLPVSVASS